MEFPDLVHPGQPVAALGRQFRLSLHSGLALAGLMLTTSGVGCMRRLQRPWMSVGFRVIGSWIAAVGVLMLGLN